MIIDVARMNPGGEQFAGADPAEILAWDASDELLQPDGPVEYVLEATVVIHELLVRGRLTARFAGCCGRCGGPLRLEVAIPDFMVSVPLPDEPHEVDLTPELRESILLALPSHPVCRSDCLGVCPRCGRPRSEGDCGCKAEAPSGWDALAALTLPNQKAAAPSDADGR